MTCMNVNDGSNSNCIKDEAKMTEVQGLAMSVGSSTPRKGENGPASSIPKVTSTQGDDILLRPTMKATTDTKRRYVPWHTNLLITLSLKSHKAVEHLHLFVDSILTTTWHPNFDVLLICDIPAFELIKIRQSLYQKLLLLHTDFHIIPTPRNTDDIMLSKYWFTDWPHISHYHKALFSDTDVLARKGLNGMFDDVALEGNGKLYALEEGFFKQYHPRLGPQFGIANYTSKDIKAMNAAGVKTFNAGILMFVPDEVFLDHIREFRKFMIDGIHKNIRHFTDQSWVNHYFNVRLLTRPILAKYIKIWPQVDQKYFGKFLLHFATWGNMTPEMKRISMRQYFGRHIVPRRFADRDEMLQEFVKPHFKIRQIGCSADGIEDALVAMKTSDFQIVTEEGCVPRRFDGKIKVVKASAIQYLRALPDHAVNVLVMQSGFREQGLLVAMMGANKVKVGGWLLLSPKFKAFEKMLTTYSTPLLGVGANYTAIRVLGSLVWA
uniref:Nucleotide-diphospho-sugar transferase domain-containing protein n=1 Tax=Eutreptiella gymnastica TaxID=73025 RepID=A0A7S4C711_9EUGL